MFPIFAAGGLAYGLYSMYRYKDSLGSLAICTAFAGIVGFVVGTVVMLIGSHTEAFETPLATLQDGQSVHGQFFLGSGSIDSEPVFFYYEKTGKSSYKLRHLSASHAVIVESDETPKVVQECRVYNASVIVWPIPTDKSADCHGGVATKFYVPKGSIQNNFMLDAQ